MLAVRHPTQPAGDGARDAAVECGDRWSGVAMDVRSRPGSRRGRWCDRRVATTAAEGVLYKQQIRLLTITIPFSVPAAKCFDFEIQDVVVTAPCFAVKLFDHVKVAAYINLNNHIFKFITLLQKR